MNNATADNFNWIFIVIVRKCFTNIRLTLEDMIGLLCIGRQESHRNSAFARRLKGVKMPESAEVERSSGQRRCPIDLLVDVIS